MGSPLPSGNGPAQKRWSLCGAQSLVSESSGRCRDRTGLASFWQRRHQLRSQPGGIPASWSLRLLGRRPEAGRIPSPTGLCSLLLLSLALPAWCVSHRTSHYQMGKRAATGPSLLLLPDANLVLSVGGRDGVWTGPASQAAGAPEGL